MTRVAKNGKTQSIDWSNPRMGRIQTYCNPSSKMSLNEELNSYSSADGELSLMKVIVMIRHGDRGPLRPVRNLSEIICDPMIESDENEFRYEWFKNFFIDAKLKLRKSKSFIPYSLMPMSSSCQLGHLSRFGAVQHLTLGSLLGQLYVKQLNLKPFDSTQLKAYTTQYPRTFQSAVAFLYGFLKPTSVLDFKNFPQIFGTVGTFFCSSPEFCEQNCRKIDDLHNNLNKDKRQILESHSAVLNLLEDLKPIIAININQSQLFQTPVAVFDGLMAYMCHKSRLPCADGNCVTLEHVKQLIAYIEFHGKQLATSHTFKHLNWLKIYGFLNQLVNRINEVESKESFLLYSAHDITIVALASALDFFDGNLPPYASRVIFETYRHNLNDNMYLRIIYNGKDVTRFTEICKTNFSHCLPFDTKDNMHLINVNVFSDFIKEKFKSITKTSDYQKACNL